MRRGIARLAAIVRWPSIGAVRVGGWMLAAGIAAVTLMPIGLRPTITADPDLERFLVFTGLGSAMALGYRTRWPWMLACALALTGTLEAAQCLTETRHGRLDDAVLKGLALLVGTLGGRAVALGKTTARSLWVDGDER